jgi:hypothetical protein
MTRKSLPKFHIGSKVTFVLDLTGDGTLSASVDDNSFHQLFSNMRSKVRSVDPEGGFVPAVGLIHCKVRFLGFDRVSESSNAGLEEAVAPRTLLGPMVQPVKQYVWKSCGDVRFSDCQYTEQLECPPMNSGIHKWSVLIEEHASEDDYYAGVGVASTVHGRFEEGVWSYDSDGEAYHNSREVKDDLPTFQKGSKVTFILDLTGDGTLIASVDGNSFHQLFSGMLSAEGGFVPSVCLPDSNAKVRFLGFESVFE